MGAIHRAPPRGRPTFLVGVSGADRGRPRTTYLHLRALVDAILYMASTRVPLAAATEGVSALLDGEGVFLPLSGDGPWARIDHALETFENHLERILQRWTSTHNDARMEGLSGIFQAARARARGYRNTATFMTMIYLIAAPIGNLFDSTWNVEEPKNASVFFTAWTLSRPSAWVFFRLHDSSTTHGCDRICRLLRLSGRGTCDS